VDTREKAEFFLKRTEPLPGESLTSLVHRLTYLNRYEDESWIVRLLEPERSRIQKFDLNIHIRSPQMRVLAAKNRTSYERIYEMTSHRFSHLLLPEQEIERDEEGHPFIKDARRAQYVRISRAKFCPVCLQEKKYHRIHWDPVYVTACLDHGVLLKDRCSSCGRPVTTLEVSRGYHRCGSDLSKEKTIGIRGIPFLLKPSSISSEHWASTPQCQRKTRRCSFLPDPSLSFSKRPFLPSSAEEPLRHPGSAISTFC